MKENVNQLALPFESIVDIYFFDRKLEKITQDIHLFLDSVGFEVDEELHFDDWFQWYKPQLSQSQKKKALLFIENWQKTQEEKTQKQVCVVCLKYTPTFLLVKTTTHYLCVRCSKKRKNKQ